MATFVKDSKNVFRNVSSTKGGVRKIFVQLLLHTRQNIMIEDKEKDEIIPSLPQSLIIMSVILGVSSPQAERQNWRAE